jgi:NhaP-type Na+/H+ or K+/H+ antiporter
VLNLLLVAFLFVLLGFQVPGIVAVVADYSVGTLLLASASLVAVVVVVRMAWALLVPPLVRRLRVGDDEISALSRQERLVLGWCGPRGAVSLAVALSLPLTLPDGSPFARRDLLLFLTVVVVLATLVGQVLPLPALLRRLRLSPSEKERTEGLRARRAMVDAALREVEDLAAQEDQEDQEPEGLEAMRQVLELRRDRLHRQLESESSDGHAGPDERDLQLRILAAERKALRDLARRGDIGRRTQIAISQELDLDETRLRRAR